MGLPWFRQGEIIETATRECETRQDWGNPVEETKHVNANANTTEAEVMTFVWDLPANESRYALAA